ncbi:MAG: O-antigen ligase family protein [Hyphomicrobiales bacterium]|nr:O-antigen ligase family protein [Hyphomicrobiales bacterium]
MQAMCLPLLLAAAPGAATLLWRRGGKPVLALLALIIALPLIQLIPMPPAIWTHLPGRGPILETYTSAGIAPPWMGVTVTPWATERLLFAMIPALAVFAGFLQIDHRARLRLWGLALAAGVASVLMQAAQLADGPQSALRFFYPGVYNNSGVGLFANNNHAGTFLFCLIPLSLLVYLRSARTPFYLAVFALFNVMVWLGLVMTVSRTSMALGAVSLLLTLAIYFRYRREPIKPVILIAAALSLAVCLIVLLSQARTEDLIGRIVSKGVLDSSRMLIFHNTWKAFVQFLPFGSGLGSFDRVYPLEAGKEIIPAIVNHAHNDYIELMLETGVAGIFGLGLFFAILLAIMRGALRSGNAEYWCLLLVMALLLVHSLWDYPLRATAINCLGAAAFGALVRKHLSDRAKA